MLAGEDIICFAKDHNEDPTSNNHVMRLLARDNRVLWLNSVATRAPRISSGRDLRKIGRKLRSFAGGLQRVGRQMWVYTPLVLPWPHRSWARRANRQILRATIALLRRRLGFERFQLWSFIPTAGDYVGHLGERCVVYYCTDEWSQFSDTDGASISAQESRLCQRADVVFTTSKALLASKGRFNHQTHLATHGVDHQHFASALAAELPLPDELRQLPRPLIGFFGLVSHWVDVALLAQLARARPGWSLVLLGKISTDVSALRTLPNVHLLGRRPYAELPRYCKAFDVALIPFVQSELTRNVNPIKLREYLSAGLPVVSTALPEVEACGFDGCVTASGVEQWLAACEEALAAASPEVRARRSRAMIAESWERKIEAIGRRVLTATADTSPAADRLVAAGSAR